MGPRRVLRRSQTKGQISDTFSPDGNSRMRQSSCKTLIKACPLNPLQLLMILTLVFVGIRRVVEDLASSALDERKKKKLQTVMLLL